MSKTAAQSSSALGAPPVGPTKTAASDLRRRIVYLMLFRLVLISLVLGATILIGWFSDVDLAAENSLALFIIIACTYLLTIVYALLINRVDRMLRFAYVQLAGDLAIATVLVHVTGGPQSAYTFFYPVTIIGAATIRFKRGAVMTTLVSVSLFSIVAFMGWRDWLPVTAGARLVPSDLTPLGFARAMGLNVAAFGAVGFLAYNLGSQLQRTSASLEVERTAAADLYALHEHIVRGLSSGLVTIDASGRVLTMNRAAREILRVDGTRTGTPLAELTPELAKTVSGLSKRSRMRRGEVRVRQDAHTELVLGISVSPLVDHLDQVHGRIINFQDLTDMRKMEAQVKHAERLATIGTVAAGVAHELRNPLASISGSIELLRSAEGDEGGALMEIVTREVDRLDELVAELLDYTNPRPREQVRFDLMELANETLRVFVQDPRFSGVDVTLGPSSNEGAIDVIADPSKLRQVLWNLLRNAAEAARSGGGHVVIEVHRSLDQALIDVTDDGPGIPSDAVRRIFEPFFTTRSGGTGLGLAIVQSIVSDHGGAIDVSTATGDGTTFGVRLPIATSTQEGIVAP